MRYYECNGCKHLYLLNDYHMCSRHEHNIGFVGICAYSNKVKE